MEKERKRFNRNQYCRVTPDGDPDIYRVTHSAHKDYILDPERHERDTRELKVTFNMPPVVTKPSESESKPIKEMSAQEIRVRFKEYCFYNVWLPVRKKTDEELDRFKIIVENWR